MHSEEDRLADNKYKTEAFMKGFLLVVLLLISGLAYGIIDNKLEIKIDLSFVAPKVADIQNIPAAENGLIVLDTNENAFKGKDNTGNFVTFGFVPSGTILPFAGSSAPAGFLLCDGSSLNRITYASLFAVIGTAYGQQNSISFNLPDLRGRFMRGFDGGAGRDPDRNARYACNPGGNSGNNVGSCQEDEFRSHTHIMSPFIKSLAYASGGSATAWNPDSTFYSTNSTGGNETRSKNISVNFIIKI